MVVANIVKIIREKKGITQNELAHSLDVSRQT
ncbi:TPA: helix-turn-helix domain-containing protein, partial [Listeria monocytogenes]|nr:helix-turn-helix domain-containing protein [Listeria monocytogenes]